MSYDENYKPFETYTKLEDCSIDLPVFEWKTEIWSGVKINKEYKRFKIDWDWKFFAILPALNINIHSLDLEFEWLFLGVYWNFLEEKEGIYINVKPKEFEAYWKESRKIG